MTDVAARSLGQGRRAGQISALGISFGCLFYVATAAAGVNFAVAWLAASVRSLLESRSGRTWFQRTSGAILIGLGVKLALVRSN